MIQGFRFHKNGNKIPYDALTIIKKSSGLSWVKVCSKSTGHKFRNSSSGVLTKFCRKLHVSVAIGLVKIAGTAAGLTRELPWLYPQDT